MTTSQRTLELAQVCRTGRAGPNDATTILPPVKGSARVPVVLVQCAALVASHSPARDFLRQTADLDYSWSSLKWES
jgi:hypothetical protein